MYESFQSPNYVLMIFMALGLAIILASPLFKQSIRESIWHWSRGENVLRYLLAFLSFSLSFMLGAAYLASLFPVISSCGYSMGITTTTSTTTTIETSTGTIVATPEIIETSSITSSSDCFDTSSLAYQSELWWSMMQPPMIRTSCGFPDGTICNSYMLSSRELPAKSLDAYVALWGTSLASAFVSLYLTAYLLRDARKRKVDESEQ